MEKLITYFGQPARIGCDEKCNKAWGVSNRPRIYPEISDTEAFHGSVAQYYGEALPDDFNYDHYIILSDDELGKAPIDPQTYEGGHAKPTSKEEMGNKWCVRECERCGMTELGKSEEPLRINSFDKRLYNLSEFNL